MNLIHAVTAQETRSNTGPHPYGRYKLHIMALHTVGSGHAERVLDGAQLGTELHQRAKPQRDAVG